jgi:GNAT superfamily N-acetyltransferase
MLARPETYYILVFEHVPSKRIIATATLLVERKFLRNAGLVGHIEDVAVDPEQRGKNLGKRVIVALTEIAEKVGCYKTILDCNEGNIRESASLLLCFDSDFLHHSLLRKVRFHAQGIRDGQVCTIDPSSGCFRLVY